MATRAKELSDLGNSGHLNVHDDGTVTLEGGNVGIGTTTPNSPLTISNLDNGTSFASNRVLQLIGTSTTDGSRVSLAFSGNTSIGNGLAIIEAVNDDQSAGHTSLHMHTYNGSWNTENLVLKGGNVGIGGDPQNGNLTIRAASTVGTINGHIMLTGDSATVGEGPQIVFSESGGGSSYAGGSIGFKRTGSNSIGDLVFGTRQSTGDANTTTTEALRINSSSNVGIGTDNPDRKLHVKSTSSSVVKFETSSSSYAGVELKNISGVANGSAAGYLYGYNSSQFLGGIKFVKKDSNSGQIVLRQQVNSTNTDVVTISDGNVGIGASTNVSEPVSRLNVRAATNHTTGSDREDLVTFHQGISAWQVGRGAGIRWVGDVSRTMAGISAYVFGVEQTGLAFETGGATSTGNLNPTTRMVIDHNGNVGIGTASPDYTLVVGNNSTYHTIKVQGINANLAATVKFKHHGGGGRTGIDPEWNISRGSDQTSFNTGVTSGNALVGGLAFWNNTIGGSNVDAMRLKDNGDAIFGYDVGIGTSTPSAKLHLRDTTSDTINAATSVAKFDGSGGDGLAFGNMQSSPYSSWIQAGYLADGYNPAFNNGYPISLNPVGGNVGIGITNPSEKLHVSGNILATGTVNASSDISLKDNITPIPNAIDKVLQIRGVTFNRNDIEDNPRQAGIIAQEVEKVLPEVVSEDKDGIKSVAYGNMVGLLIEAIKEQQEQINMLKEKLENK